MLSHCQSRFRFPGGFRSRMNPTAPNRNVPVNGNGICQISFSNNMGTGFRVTAASPSFVSSALLPLVDAVRVRLRYPRSCPELGLLSLLLALSTAFRNLAISMHKLSKLVYEEVPGTLSSLKLSGLELNQLTHQLTTLRHKISVSKGGNGGRASNSASQAPRN